MSEHKFEFKPEDFMNFFSIDAMGVMASEEMTELCNAKIAPLFIRINKLEELLKLAAERNSDLLERITKTEEMIENAPVIHFQYGASEAGKWNQSYWHAATHKAKLVCIEEIK